MKLRNYYRGLGMTDSVIAQHIQEASGLNFTRKLISQAADGEAIPLPKAQALCEFLSKEYGRTIKPSDISDLKVI